MKNEISFKNDVLPLKNKLYRLALRITMDTGEAEDVVQDTLIRVWNKRDEWDELESIEAYCMTICKNLSLDRHEKKDAQNIQLDEALHDSAEISDNPESSLELKDRVELVHRLINSLPDKQKIAIQLREIEGKNYKDIADIMAGGECYDGLIITGAPVEQMPFEDVRYWKQLLDIYSWMQVHVNAILHICWGAQAALYGLFGIPKYDLREKMFGIFEQKIEISSLPIFKGFSNTFFMPHSRHTEIRRSDISPCKALEIVASSPVAGVSVVQTKDWRQLFVTGHLEYMPGRLAFEYRRDLKKHLPIHIPYNYFENDDPNGAIIDSWRNDARRFYKNWLENYVNNHSLSHVNP